MCGIFGIHDRRQNTSQEVLFRATQALAHRGPDGQGTWRSPDQSLALGHRRLNIVDVADGTQPMTNDEESICISVNGEFYDEDLLRKDLEKKGHHFNTRSDSELLIHLYQEYGKEFVHYLRGEFAFILHDIKKHITIAGRDRLGIKPLCYHLTEGGVLYLSSEAKAIFAAGVEAKWNQSALYQAFCLQYTPQNQTLFENIQQLAPGHLMIFDGSNLSIEQYWDLEFPESEIKGDFQSLSEQLDNQLRESIAYRLRSDNAKICCHLSGGIDSATIAALASELHGKPITCFSVSFPHETYDELSLAKAQSQKIGSEFHPVYVDADDIVSVLPEAVYYSEGLAINNHLSAKYILNREIKQLGYKIALTGEGSDELFSGYPHLKQDYMSNDADKILSQNPVSAGVQISSDESLSLKIIQGQLNAIPSFLKAKASIGFKLHQLMSRSPVDSHEVFRGILQENSNIMHIQNLHPVYQSTYLWVKYTLAGYILKTLGDGCEMAHGIEGRVPFLDHHLFALAAKTPLKHKISNGIEKYILRETVKPYVTNEIYGRQKHPFMAPPLSLLKNQKGFDFIADTLRSQEIKNVPFLEYKKISNYVDALKNETSFKGHVTAEPVLMLMVTSSLLQKQYKL